ncbi:MAG: flippase-like domain-containing protein [Anaerolineaceae bacterium]|nr:MAG: flippase-like domain-containing protein [Anaerolineaceae bacterium]
MRKLLYVLILILAIIFIRTHLTELQSVVSILSQGDWRFLLAAVGVQLLWLVNIAAALQSTYRLVGVREHLRHMIPLATAANFVNVVAPSYGLGALAVLISDGNQRGKRAAKVSTGAVLYLVYDYLGFLVVLLPGTIILVYRGVLDAVLITALTFAVSVAVITILLTLLGIRSADKLGHAVLWLTDKANRALRPVLRREVIDQARAQDFTQDFAEGLQHVRRSPGRLLLPFLLALSRKLVMMTILYLVSMAFHTPLDLFTLIAVFSTSYLFTIASVTPSGVGFVEGAMLVYLNALQIPLATSAAISLAYRGITFWLTLVYGLIAIRIVDYSNGRLKKTRSPSGASLFGDQRTFQETTVPTGSPISHYYRKDCEPSAFINQSD